MREIIIKKLYLSIDMKTNYIKNEIGGHKNGSEKADL